MDEEEDMDIAAAMGFGSFGGTKKRKYDQASSPKAASKEDASGANTTQLGVRTKKVATQEIDIGDVNSAAHDTVTSHAASALRAKNAQKTAPTGLADFLARAQTLPDKSSATQGTDSAHTEAKHTEETISFGGPVISRAELNALKFGVKNEQGDTAYFLPSFVEDPWAKLKSGR